MEIKNRRRKIEYDQKLLDLARVTRVVKGGRRFRFRATIVIGNRRGRIGLGIGKGPDVSSAISKGFNQAKKKLVEVSIYKGTIPHVVECKFKSARVIMKPARKGRGLVAGGAVRAVAELAGIRDMSAKIVGKANKTSNAMAAIRGLVGMKKRDLPVIEKKEKKLKEKNANSPNKTEV